MALWDTAGQEEYDRLRPLSYPDTHVLLICFSVDNPDSLENIPERWIPEVVHFCPKVPIVIVGNKCDLRDDPAIIQALNRHNPPQKPISFEQGSEIAEKLGQYKYMEVCLFLNYPFLAIKYLRNFGGAILPLLLP